jgi:Prophage CP4-57 regulatory protein (AlpA)
MSDNIVTKAAVSVTEMAKMVGLSRARLYQLIKKGTFPPADQDEVTKRPCYLEEKQRQILEARRRNCGVDGKPCLFYSRRNDSGQKRTATRPTIGKVKEVVKKYTDLIDGLAALNVTASVAQVEPLVKELFPNGTDGVELGEVIRAVFLRIQSQNPGDSQRR